MNYEDEPYVRLYTRDTATWNLLGWEGQTVLMHMLRGRFDRSGVFSCDGHDPSHAVTAVTRLPLEIVKVGLARLLEFETWVLTNGKLVWPNLLEAQNCRRSERLRQAESRKKRRETCLSSNGSTAPITSRNVTDSHEPSQASQSVTLSSAQPSLAQDPPKPPEGGDRQSGVMQTAAPAAERRDQELRASVRRVFEAWKHDTGHHRSELDRKRGRRIAARLQEGLTEAELIRAITNRRNDPFLMGTSKNGDGKVYDGIETLLRDRGQVERLLALGEPRRATEPVSTPNPPLALWKPTTPARPRTPPPPHVTAQVRALARQQLPRVIPDPEDALKVILEPIAKGGQ